VKATGLGYTLSGKELDPNSAAAKPYLSRQNGTVTIDTTEKDKTQESSESQKDEERVNQLAVGTSQSTTELTLSSGAEQQQNSEIPTLS
jgi:hypothetical protein